MYKKFTVESSLDLSNGYPQGNGKWPFNRGLPEGVVDNCFIGIKRVSLCMNLANQDDMVIMNYFQNKLRVLFSVNSS